MNQTKRLRVNHQITAREVRLIGTQGSQLGIVSFSDAMVRAEAEGVDLVEVSPQAQPPVVRMVDWGKFQYELEKQATKARRNQKSTEIKQVRIGLKTGAHDLGIKASAIRKFIEAGHKVKLTLRFRGREITHPELGRQILDNFYSQLSDIATIEQSASMTGRDLSMIIMRKK